MGKNDKFIERDAVLYYTMLECPEIESSLHSAIDVVEDNGIRNEDAYYNSFSNQTVLINYLFQDMNYFNRLKDLEYREKLIQTSMDIYAYDCILAVLELGSYITRISVINAINRGRGYCKKL